MDRYLPGPHPRRDNRPGALVATPDVLSGTTDRVIPMRRARHDDARQPARLPRPGATNLRKGRMRDVLALLLGLAISLIGLLVVLASDLDLPGALLIVGGVAVAFLTRNRGTAGRLR